MISVLKATAIRCLGGAGGEGDVRNTPLSGPSWSSLCGLIARRRRRHALLRTWRREKRKIAGYVDLLIERQRSECLLSAKEKVVGSL